MCTSLRTSLRTSRGAHFTAYFTGCVPHMRTLCVLPCPYTASSLQPPTLIISDMCFLRHVLQRTLTSLSSDMCFINTYITFLRHVLQQTLTSLSSGMCFNKHLHHFPPTCASTPSSDNTFLRQHFPPTCASTFTYITFLRHVLQHFPPTTLSSGMCFNKHLHQHQSNPNMYSSWHSQSYSVTHPPWSAQSCLLLGPSIVSYYTPTLIVSFYTTTLIVSLTHPP